MEKLLLVGLGGFVGSVFRYVLSGMVQNLSRSFTFPYGTFAVNVLGCLVIGLLSQLSETRGLFGDSLRLFIFVGILGGFTTFSAFGNETYLLLRDGEAVLAMWNALGQAVICLFCVWFGRMLVHWIWG